MGLAPTAQPHRRRPRFRFERSNPEDFQRASTQREEENSIFGYFRTPVPTHDAAASSSFLAVQPRCHRCRSDGTIDAASVLLDNDTNKSINDDDGWLHDSHGLHSHPHHKQQ